MEKTVSIHKDYKQGLYTLMLKTYFDDGKYVMEESRYGFEELDPEWLMLVEIKVFLRHDEGNPISCKDV